MPRAVRCFEGVPTIVDVDAPPPTDEHVRVRVVSAGICGSDLHLASWNLRSTLGHEFAGLLDDGRPVAVEPVDACGECDACRADDYHLCVRGVRALIGVGRDGGMADQCNVPVTSIAPLPRALDPRDACLAEPLAVAVHGTRRGDVQPTQRVAIIGGGTIGQCALVAATARGAQVDVAARHDRQREVAQRLGARSLEPTDGYDVVIEAAGTGDALADAINRCKPGGAVVLLATYWDGHIDLPAMETTLREIRLVPASLYNRANGIRDFDVAVDLLSQNPEITRAIITHRFPLDAVAEAFDTARDRQAGAIKVVLEP